MPRNETVLTPERKLQIAQAFKAWYDDLPERGRARYKAMQEIGGSQTLQYVFRSGERTPTPTMLVKLYKLTSNRAFLYSKEEKVRITRLNPRALPLPDKMEWPDSDEVATVAVLVAAPVAVAIDVDQIAADITVLAGKIRQLADLDSQSPERKQARKVLVKPTMLLFRALMTLRLEVPKDFADLLHQLDIINRVLK